ncbi:MAG: SusD/RagB family nutrient-binding outer membrane lipoprotein [Sphingobacteriia bacterium]|nr:SusD/RagB family nutrient-binding outer membrane lipoprotein [Sphingobacteriia bacterium]
MKKLLFIGMCTVLLGSACTKDWLQDYTADPARPLEVSVKVLLPSAQVSYTMAQGDALPRLTSIFLQQMTGADRQSLAHNRYAQIGEADFDVIWADNGYAGGMKDLQLIIEATEGKSPRYCGIARIMMAQYLGMFTDIWGDIPYGNALKGADDYNPSYVSQQQIYTSIEEMLTTAIAELGQPVGAIAPGSEDLIYGGNVTKWTKLAWSLKARYLNHLSKKGALYRPADILTAVSNGMSSSADNAKLTFLAAPNNNPWYQFNTQRAGYILQFGTMYDRMTTKNDPRISAFRSADSTEMPYYGSETSPVNWMTYAELLFIKAEVESRQSAGTLAATLDAAVEAHMSELGVSSAAAATYVGALPAAPALSDVMYEKHLALFSHVEAWTDWRRTGYPTLAVYPGAQLPEIPRRMPYPQGERLYNDNFIDLQGNNSFLTRHWWDQP